MIIAIGTSYANFATSYEPRCNATTATSFKPEHGPKSANDEFTKCSATTATNYAHAECGATTEHVTATTNHAESEYDSTECNATAEHDTATNCYTATAYDATGCYT